MKQDARIKRGVFVLLQEYTREISNATFSLLSLTCAGNLHSLVSFRHGVRLCQVKILIKLRNFRTIPNEILKQII